MSSETSSSYHDSESSSVNTAADSQTPDEWRCQPFPAISGVVTCPELRQYNFGIVSEWSLLCCLECPQEDVIINYSTARAHLTGVHKRKLDNRRESVQYFKDMCNKLHVRRELLPDVPTPTGFIAPLPFLKVFRAYRCELCEENKIDTFRVSATSRRDHFEQVHHITGLGLKQLPDRYVHVQTFCNSTYNPKTWFQVYPELLLVQQQEASANDENTLGKAPMTARDLAEAYLSESTEIGLPNVAAKDLQDVMPFLHFCGWAIHLQGRSAEDIKRLRELVEAPSRLDDLRRIYKAAAKRFRRDQRRLQGQSEIYRLNLMDDESSNPTKSFNPLAKDTIKDYGRTWGLWCVFVCRLRELMPRDATFYPINFTKEQEHWMDLALEYCDETKPRTKHVKDILYGLADAFWRPDGSTKFRKMVDNQFSDATVRFAVLMNLYPNGEFATPRNACHQLVRIKYFIRSALYFWSLELHKKQNLDLDGVVPFISGAVSRRKVTPFSTVCLFVSHATTYANTSVHLPNTIWADDESVNVEGHRIHFPQFRQKMADTVRHLETLIGDELLLGRPPEHYGFNITEETDLEDQLSNSTPGHSVFDHDRFKALRHSLALKFFEDEGADFLIDRDNSTTAGVEYHPRGAANYLASYHKALRTLSFCMHIMGGQPGRGTEFMNLAWTNGRYRVRNVYMVGPGKMVYVLFYNKTTSQTGFDRVVAHAIPWRLARLALLLKGLVAPFAGALLRKVSTEDGCAIHQHRVFTQDGKTLGSEDLSDEIYRWFITHFQKPIRLRVCRQFLVAVQRKYMRAAFETVKRALLAADSQAGHTSETARRHYAIDVEEAHILGGETIAKYIEVSNWWWRVLFDGMEDMLTRRELGPPMPESDSFATIQRDISTTVQPETLRTMLSEVITKGDLGRQIAAEFTQLFRNMGLDSRGVPPVGSESWFHRQAELERYLSIPATVVPVQARHLHLLHLYTRDSTAVWTSKKQAQALVHILARQTSLLIILPTGGGKSLLFGAMQYFERAITVVVFPLRALMNDQLAAAAKRDPEKPWPVWHANLQVFEGIVAVPVESLDDDNFRIWCDTNLKRRLLSRIVIDECHIIPSSTDFRFVMRNLEPIIETRVPLVCLTATLPPDMEGELSARIGHPSWCVIRRGTQRRNLHFRIARYANRGDAEIALKMVMDRYVSEIPKRQGALIVVRTYKEADKLSKLLGYPCYYSDKPSDTKDAIATNWIAGRVKVIIGTSAVGTGVHHAGCVLVVHWDVPYGMLPYAQETGRAGREGQEALCLLIHWGNVYDQPKQDLKGYGPLKTMLLDDTCIRLHTSRYLDGRQKIVTCFNGYALCGRCIVLMRLASTRSGHRFSPEQLTDVGEKTLPRGVMPPELIYLGHSDENPPQAPESMDHPPTDPVELDEEEEDDDCWSNREGIDTEAESDADGLGEDIAPEAQVYHGLANQGKRAQRTVTPDAIEDEPRTSAPRNAWARPLKLEARAGPPVAWSRKQQSAETPAWADSGHEVTPFMSAPMGATRSSVAVSHQKATSTSAAGPSRVQSRAVSSSGMASRPAEQRQLAPTTTIGHQSGTGGEGRLSPGAHSALAAPTRGDASGRGTQAGGSSQALQQHDAVPHTSPTRPTYIRTRPEAPESPTNRRQAVTRFPTSTEALSNASRQLFPMQSTGSQVQSDASRSIIRRSAAVDPHQSYEDSKGAFSFANLIRIKSEVSRWCFYCLVHQPSWSGHTSGRCRVSGQTLGYGLHGIVHNSETFIGNRDWLRGSKRIPRDATMCGFCFWPWHNLHQHPLPAGPKATPQDCSASDFLLQFSWTLLAHDESRSMLADYFSLPTQFFADPHRYSAWLMEKVDTNIRWNGATTTMYNIHRVFLWWTIIVRDCHIPGAQLTTGDGDGSRRGASFE